MSIESVLGRIAEITAPAQQQQAAPPPAQSTNFANTLAQATTGSAAPAPTATPLPLPAYGSTLASDTTIPAYATTLTQVATANSGPTPYGAEIEAAAARNGVDPNLIRAVIKQESGFNPNAGSGAGAQGLMQLMPSTAAGLGVTNPFDPAQSIEGGTKYLKTQLDRFGGDVSLALAAYNAGPGAVAQYGGVPPYGETQRYVQNVLANFQSFSSSNPQPTERSPF